MVEDNLVDTGTSLGIRVDGDGSIVRTNQVLSNGSATGAAGSLTGILTSGSVDVLGNTVSGLVATTGSNGSATGIYTNFTSAGGSTSVNDNHVKGLHADGTGVSIALYNVSASARASIRNNDLSGDSSTGSIGIACSSATYRAKYNIIDGFATYLVGCFNVGNNDEKH